MSRRRGSVAGPSLGGLAGVMIGLPIAYLSAEGVLSGNMHPIHWVLTVAGGGLSYLIGDVIARMRARHDQPGSMIRRAYGGRSSSNLHSRPRRRRR